MDKCINAQFSYPAIYLKKDLSTRTTSILLMEKYRTWHLEGNIWRLDHQGDKAKC